MAVEYKAGGNKFSRGMRKVLSFFIIFLIIYLVLSIIGGILVLFDVDGLYNVLIAIGEYLEYGLMKIWLFISPFLLESGILHFLSTYLVPIVTVFFILSFFWALIFRGYWKLILRPYMVVMTVIGFSIFSLVSSYFALDGTFISPFLELASVLVSFNQAWEPAIQAAVDFIFSYRISYIFAYYVLMWFLCRIEVWLAYSSNLYYLLPSEAKDECLEVLKEARKKAWGLPMRVKFYVAPDDSFNAFAFAHNKVAIHTGALNECDAEVLRGVIAHELGHIAHLDVTATVIAQTNFLMMFFAITIPGILVSSFAPREGERVNIFTYIIWVVFFLLMRLVQTLMQSIHYVCYLIGGKRCEYAADKFAVKIGEGTGLIRFMAAFINAPSGGFSDPHPSIRNRLSHVLTWIDRSKNENYKGIDTGMIRSNLL